MDRLNSEVDYRVAPIAERLPQHFMSESLPRNYSCAPRDEQLSVSKDGLYFRQESLYESSELLFKNERSQGTGL